MWVLILVGSRKDNSYEFCMYFAFFLFSFMLNRVSFRHSGKKIKYIFQYKKAKNKRLGFI